MGKQIRTSTTTAQTSLRYICSRNNFKDSMHNFLSLFMSVFFLNSNSTLHLYIRIKGFSFKKQQQKVIKVPKYSEKINSETFTSYMQGYCNRYSYSGLDVHTTLLLVFIKKNIYTC